MARYAKSDTSERRTAQLCLQLTPAERSQLDTGAKQAGIHLSQYVRELCLRRSGDAPMVAGTRRNPDARTLAHALTAIGNNLNQLARIANSTKAMPQLAELHRTMEKLKAALARVIAL